MILAAGEEESDVGSAQDDDDLYPCPQPWTGWRAQSGRRALRQGRRIIMLIRIKRRDKPRDKAQPAVDKRLSMPWSLGPMASYTGKKQEFRILCGSV
jgi:hypothetical protein